jgi:hypothetical protein
MIDRRVFFSVGISIIPLLCVDALIFIFSKEQTLAGKFYPAVQFHVILCFLSYGALSLSRLFSGRALRRKPYTEREKKISLFAMFNALVCVALMLAFSADWLSNPPELLQFFRGFFSPYKPW